MLRARTTVLTHWKGEHQANSNEDAAALDGSRGLFAVADGVGTASFSNLWAQIVVDAFLREPILSADPFELRWWLRRRSDEFQRTIPPLASLPELTQRKAREGSHCALVSLRITRLDADRASAVMMAMGDCCALVHRHRTGAVRSFPLNNPAEFTSRPVVLPSLPTAFDAAFHRLRVRRTVLELSDVVILASDAVAKWLLSAGGGRWSSAADAMGCLLGMSAQQWGPLVEAARQNGEMEDDDATAMILRFTDDPADEGLGSTFRYPRELTEARQADYLQARSQGRKDLMAMNYGDGRCFADSAWVSAEEVADARAVASAFFELLVPISRALWERTEARADLDRVGRLWAKHRNRLLGEPTAAHLQEALVRLGIEPGHGASAPSEQTPYTPEPPRNAERPDELRDSPPTFPSPVEARE